MTSKLSITCLCVGLQLAATFPAAATDIATASAPSALNDLAMKIGSRTLQVSQGHWSLLQREAFETSSRGNHKDVDIYGAWSVSVQNDELQAIVHLTLPISDAPKMRRWDVNPCDPKADLLRVHRTSGHSENECLAIIGIPDLRSMLDGTAAPTSRWLSAHRIRGAESAVEIVYTLRSEGSYGRLEVFWPATAFESDDDAATWGNALRESIRPLFAGRVGSAMLPPLPDRHPEPGTASADGPAPVKTANDAWIACLRDTEEHLDDRSTPAIDMGAVLYLKCRDEEARNVMDALGADRAQRLSRAEADEILATAHRQTVDSGLATSIVLEHRAGARRPRSGP